MALRALGIIVCALVLASCATGKDNNDGMLQSYPAPTVEAGWIRNGESLEYDGAKWDPVDDTENFMDSEMYQVGEYKGVQIFVEKIDTKPYDRIYTKFAKGKFRFFERERND